MSTATANPTAKIYALLQSLRDERIEALRVGNDYRAAFLNEAIVDIEAGIVKGLV